MEQFEKVMRLWTSFLEPMLGVPIRPHGAEDTEEAVKVKNSAAKGSAANIIGESDGSAGADIGNTNLKQPTPVGNGEENSTMGTAISVRVRMANGESTIRGNGIHETDQNRHKSEGGKSHSAAPVADEMPGTAMQVGRIEKLDDSNAVNAVATESSSGRLGLDHVSG